MIDGMANDWIYVGLLYFIFWQRLTTQGEKWRLLNDIQFNWFYYKILRLYKLTKLTTLTLLAQKIITIYVYFILFN